MKDRNIGKLLNIASLLNKFLFLFPAFVAVKYYLYETTGGIGAILLQLFSMFLGLTLTTVICRKEYYFTTKLLSYSAVIIPILLSVLTFSQRGVIWTLIEMLASGTFYFIGVSAYTKSYGEIFDSQNLYVGSFLLILYLIIVSNFSVLLPLKNMVYIFILLFILISMLIKSEENIDQVFMLRGVEIPEVQKVIRKYNAKAIFSLFAGILILFNIRYIVSAVLKFIFILYLRITVLILYLMSLIYPEGSGQGNGAGKPDLPYGPESTNNFLDNIFKFISVVIILYLAYKIVPKVIKAIFKLVAHIKAWLFRVVKVRDDKYDDDECVDIVEFTKQVEVKKLGKKKKNSLYSALRKATSPAEKIRLMYAIIVNDVRLKGIKIADSDTTGQIAGKITDSWKYGEDIREITSIYDSVRYGEEIPQDSTVKFMEQGFKGFTDKMGK